MALTPRQYLSHIERKRGCPPRSQLLVVSSGLRDVARHRSNLPFQRDMASLDSLHVEAYGRDRATGPQC